MATKSSLTPVDLKPAAQIKVILSDLSFGHMRKSKTDVKLVSYLVKNFVIPTKRLSQVGAFRVLHQLLESSKDGSIKR